jgi:hypothetical protein
MKTIAPLWQLASILMMVLITVLNFIFGGSGFEPALLAALLIAFMSQMSCFTLVGLSDVEELSKSLDNRRAHADMVGGTAISVILILTIMLWKLATVML